MKTKTCASFILAGLLPLSCAFGAGLINPSFEIPAVTGGGVNFGTAPAGFGWQVAGGDVDLIRAYWVASDGVQSIDLNGWNPGILYQDFTFSNSGKWAIRFDMSANPDDGVVKAMRMDFGTPGSLLTLGTWSVDPAGRTTTDMKWLTFTTPTFEVPDASVIYRLQLTSLVAGYSGAALDNFKLVEVPEPAMGALLALAGVLGVLWRWLRG